MGFKDVIIKKRFFIPVICMVVIVFCVRGFELNYANKYYPGVTINGRSVAGKTYNNVLAEFTAKSENLTKHGLDLVFVGENGKKEMSISATATGFTPDAIVEYFSVSDFKTSLSFAYDWGRKGNMIQRFKEQLALAWSKNFDAPVFVHREAIDSLLSGKIKDIFTVSDNARFSFDGNGTVVVVPEKLGENISKEKIIDIVEQKLTAFDTTPIVFNLEKEIPPATKEKLTPLLPLVKKIADIESVNFYYQNHVWKVGGKTLATWITLRPNNTITIDDKKLAGFLSVSMEPFINNPPQNSRFKIGNGPDASKAGFGALPVSNLIEVSPGKPGEAVDVEKIVTFVETVLATMQQETATIANIGPTLKINDSEITFSAKNNTVNIPIIITTAQPAITQKTITQYSIKDLIGTATTNFAGGSLDRQHNIEVGVSKITGVLIAPGQEFSTVNAIGAISEEAGFVKEFVINREQTVKELGGGLCQLSTTLFRTVLNSGLPITERTNHKYVIPYYGPGLDATVYGPHPDFRFVNDTGNYLLLQGITKNNQVTFELYGVKDGRIATISKPELYDEKPVPPNRNIPSPDLYLGQIQCTTSTYKGITADATYTVTYQDGTIKTQVFHSVYQPWPKVCLIGTLPNPPLITTFPNP